jgi:hypothetical protein
MVAIELIENLGNLGNISPNMNMTKILIMSTQLGANYEQWENNEDIQSILNINENSLCKMIKIYQPQLDDKSIKCIVLAMYIFMYTEIINITNSLI